MTRLNRFGYSGKPLYQKLGINHASLVTLMNEPEEYFDLLQLSPSDLNKPSDGQKPNIVHIFVKTQKELEKKLPTLKTSIDPAGMIWVSWPKKSSTKAGDITEDTIRTFALKTGLVDVKVCSLSDMWSGLKLVIRVKDR